MSNRATRLQVPVLAGWRTPYTFLGTPLVAPGGERVLPDLLLDGLRGKLTGAALLEELPLESAAWAALEDAIARGDVVARAPAGLRPRGIRAERQRSRAAALRPAQG